MSAERELRFGNAGVLENLRGVPMRKEIVGFEVFVNFDEMEVATGILAGTAGSGFAIANDAAARSDPEERGKRAKSQDYAGGVATRIGNELRRLNLLGIKFGNAVRGLGQRGGVRRRQLVPGSESVRGAKPKCTTEID